MNESIQEAASLSEKLAESLSFKVIATVNIFGFSIPITETVVVTWGVMALILTASFFLGRKLSLYPKGIQVGVEALVGTLNNICKEKMGHYWRTFAPFILTIAIFLSLANMISIFSPISAFGFEAPFEIKPPTRDINVTAAFAITVIAIVFISGLITKGPIGWAKTLFKPMPFMLPFNLMEYAIKPLSLALRLFGNILGAFVIMRLLEIAMPLALPPVVAVYFDLFDGVIQAVVFTYLTCIYIGEAVE